MRFMYDAVTPTNIPRDAEMVAGYLNGPYAWSMSEWNLFPNAVHVGISVRGNEFIGQVLDVEPGDATPYQAVDWVVARRNAGIEPSVYCNLSTYPSVEKAFVDRGVMGPYYWIAKYDNIPTFPNVNRCFAKQFMNTPGWDKSSVADFWPGIDGNVIVLPERDDTMFTFEIPAAPNGGRYILALPASRACEVSMAIGGQATITEYAWTDAGGNGFSQVNENLNDRLANTTRPPRGTVELDIQYKSNAVIRGVVDIIG